jgi:hypothetical protein
MKCKYCNSKKIYHLSLFNDGKGTLGILYFCDNCGKLTLKKLTEEEFCKLR